MSFDDEKGPPFLHPVDAEVIWNWFGDHGCFIGGDPFGKDYSFKPMIALETTPFEQLYVVQASDQRPNAVLAMRLLPSNLRSGRCPIQDGMERLVPLGRDERTMLYLYEMMHPDDPPEAWKKMEEEDFLKEYAGPSLECLVQLPLSELLVLEQQPVARKPKTKNPRQLLEGNRPHADLKPKHADA